MTNNSNSVHASPCVDRTQHVPWQTSTKTGVVQIQCPATASYHTLHSRHL
jgi:hypothetical protein